MENWETTHATNEVQKVVVTSPCVEANLCSRYQYRLIYNMEKTGKSLKIRKTLFLFMYRQNFKKVFALVKFYYLENTVLIVCLVKKQKKIL